MRLKPAIGRVTFAISAACAFGVVGVFSPADSSAQVTATTGDIEVVAIPASLEGGAFVSQTRIRLMNEGLGVVTTTMPRFTYDSAYHEGPYPGGTNVTTPATGPGLPAVGTQVHSILLHFDPNLSSLPFSLTQGITRSATLTFDRPILGVYVASSALIQTDAIFGSRARFSSSSGRGMEFTYAGDRFVIDPGRRVLTLSMFGHNGGVFDEMRIILAAQPATTIPNNPPVANGQSVSTDEDVAVNVTLTGSDADNEAITFEVVTSPAHGVLGGAGAVRTYTPTGNYNGTDSFTFRVFDGKALSATATVNVTVRAVNDPPVAGDQNVTTPVGKAATVTLQATDIDGGTLTFAIIDLPAHGALSGSGAARTYTPAAGYVGSDSFTFRANDGLASSAIATVRITVTATPVGQLEFGTVTVGGTPVFVTLANSYVKPVVVTSANYRNNTRPVVVRMRRPMPTRLRPRLPAYRPWPWSASPGWTEPTAPGRRRTDRRRRRIRGCSSRPTRIS